MAQITAISAGFGGRPRRRADPSSFNRRLLREIGELGIRYVRPKVPSRTLRKALNFFVFSEARGFIQIPHYWALYVHDGRGPFSMPPGKVMCWFRVPRDDPRLHGGVSPVRRKDLRRLTADEFKFWMNENREAIKLGVPPPMIVTRHIRKGTPATPFFDNGPGGGMIGFAEHVNREVGPKAQAELTAQLGDLLDIRDTARLVI